MSRSRSLSIFRSSRRRTLALVAGLALAVSGVLAAATASGATAHGNGQPKPTIVRVHGALADSSSWNSTVARLQHDRYPTIPSYFLTPTGDKNIPPAAQEFMADRAHGTTVTVRSASHAVLGSRPHITTRLIERAANETT